MKKILAVAALAAALAGCASNPKLTHAERMSLYQAHAGEEVDEFRLVGRIQGWQPLDDSTLVVWTRSQEAWLLDLMGPCQDLDYATAITLSSSANMVHKRFDAVTPIGSMVGSVGRMPCRIERIRPLDTRALKQAQEELREAQTTARPPQAHEQARAPR